MGTLAGMATVVALPDGLAHHTVTRLIIGWNVGAWLYLALAVWLIFRAPHDHMRLRARLQDEGRIVVLALVVLAAVVSLAAIVAELQVVKDMQGVLKFAHIALTAATIVSSWAFTQVMFAFHYAHDYYLARARGEHGGLIFPECDAPDYVDFLYFACVIGTSGQTADVSIASPTMRRTGLVHCVLAYAFNTTVLALTINIASGLL
ncbi:DUF1345 domain-containing protein [Niveibacterium umoris]